MYHIVSHACHIISCTNQLNSPSLMPCIPSAAYRLFADCNT